MLSGLGDWMVRTERKVRRSFGNNIDTPGRRALAHFHLFALDHGIFRLFWTNGAMVDDGVWRSNQPSPRRLRKIRQSGIETVLNLRGPSLYSQFLFEREACEKLGIKLISHKLAARRAPSTQELLRLAEIFDTIERPFLMHCKSGADRAGFASVFWQVYRNGADPREMVKEHLNWRYLHLPQTSTGILDLFWEHYARARDKDGIGLIDWIRDVYDFDALQAAFRSGERA